MKTRIRNLTSFVLLSATSLTLLFGSQNTQPSGNPQTAPAVTVPSIVKPGSDKGDMRTRADTLLPSVRYRSQIDLNQTSVTLEQLNIRSFTLEPNQIGVNRSVEISPNTRAQKFVHSDGSQIIVLIIKSSGASGIGVHFRNFALADGDEVYVYGAAADSVVFGPYTNQGPWGSGEFWSGSIDGDTVVIEFYTKPGENGKAFEIFEISHIFAQRDWRLRSDQPDVLPCQVDASCNSVIEKDGVARILFNDNGPKVCTGTLLNDRIQDFCPYFLTANHCVDSQAVAQTVEVYWFYQTTSCNSGVLRSDWIHSPPGANLLATESSNDFSLLRLLSDVPGEALFSGWDPNPQPTGTAVFGLHHPDGYVPPAVASYLRRSDGSITETNANCPASGLVNGYEIHWTSGTTEGGSSGSGLFTSNGHYLVGVDSCGMQSCDVRDTWYSKFANLYPQIQPYIDANPPRTSPPLATAATLVTSNSFTTKWRSACSATGYRLDVATNNAFTNYVAGYQDLNVGNTTSRSVTGLNASTTYYYRVRAYNGGGTSGNSNVISVTTLTATGPPVVATNPATNVTSSSATLNGTVNPNGLSTQVWFQYGTTTNYGSSTAHQTKTGNNNQNVSANISGLTAGTTYHFRIVASNTGGTRYGGDRTFTTVSTPPVVTTNPATNVTNSSATLKGSVNPNGSSTIVYFQYGTTISYGSRTLDQTKTGNTNQNVSANISGLATGTTYHFRIVATNSGGTRYGGDRTFTTVSIPPAVTTNPATLIAGFSATLNGTVDPNGLSTQVWFEYGRTTSYGSSTAHQTKTGNANQNVSANIGGLTANTTYHFRIVASNPAGTTRGADKTCTTSSPTGPPVVTTNPATNVTSSSATLNGAVNPHGLSTTVYFQYGTTISYGSRTPNQSKTGNNSQNVSANISGLAPGATYHFRIVASNTAGTRYGADRTFTAVSRPPVVTTNPATLIAGFSATLNGSINPNGLSIQVWFEYGRTTSYGSSTTHQTKTGNTNQNVSANIGGLTANTTYHFRIVASNTAGTTRGGDRTFTTLSPTGAPVVTTNPATNVTNSSATLNGTVNPHGFSTTVYFQYGTTISYGRVTANQTKTGNNNQNVSANISGLTPGTTYHFRIVATNTGGTTYGGDRTFTPVSLPPVVQTLSATLVTSYYASLNGTINPNGSSVEVWFAWGETTSYGHETPHQVRSGNTIQSVGANIGNLEPSTPYHFRICASAGGPNVCGADRTFTTLSLLGLPLVTTNPATNVTSSSATLNGTVNPHGYETTVFFQYGETTSYGGRTPNQTKIGTNYQNVSANISGLIPGRIYHYRVVAINDAGRTNGADRTFTTPPPANCNIAGTWAGTVSVTLHNCPTTTSSFSMVITEINCGPPPPPTVGPCYEGSANWNAACFGENCQPAFYNITGHVAIYEYQYNTPCNDFWMEFSNPSYLPCWILADYSYVTWHPVTLSQDGNTLRGTISGHTVNLTRQ